MLGQMERGFVVSPRGESSCASTWVYTHKHMNPYEVWRKRKFRTLHPEVWTCWGTLCSPHKGQLALLCTFHLLTSVRTYNPDQVSSPATLFLHRGVSQGAAGVPWALIALSGKPSLEGLRPLSSHSRCHWFIEKKIPTIQSKAKVPSQILQLTIYFLLHLWMPSWVFISVRSPQLSEIFSAGTVLSHIFKSFIA